MWQRPDSLCHSHYTVNVIQAGLPCLDKFLVGEILVWTMDTKKAWIGCDNKIHLLFPEAKLLSTPDL